MKNIFFGIFLVIICQNSFSQNWSPDGATWTYTYVNLAVYGYVEIKYVGDTSINSIVCKKLKKDFYGYDYSSSHFFNGTIGYEYMYEQNRIVYLWIDNNFDTLYNFNASIGDSWRMAKRPFTNTCDSTISVIDTGTITINSLPLKYLVVQFEYGENSSSHIKDTIIEKIGFNRLYMFPDDYCNGMVDGNEGGNFRCYHDDNFATYKPHYSNNCDFIVGMNKTSVNNIIKVFPNPFDNKIFIYGLQDVSQITYSVFSVEGEELTKGCLKNNSISLENLSSGVYFLRLTDRESTRLYKLMKE